MACWGFHCLVESSGWEKKIKSLGGGRDFLAMFDPFLDSCFSLDFSDEAFL